MRLIGIIVVSIAIHGCMQMDDRDPCPTFDARPTPAVTCGGEGEQCCLADVDGHAVLVCHGDRVCDTGGERGVCRSPGAN